MKMFNHGDADCFPLSYYKKKMIEEDIKELKLEEMKQDIGGPMWCKVEEDFIGETREECGKWNCDKYAPCNGKSGRCKYLINGYIEMGKKFILQRNGNNKLKLKEM